MKKIIVLMLALGLLVMGVSSCGKEEVKEPETNATEEQNPDAIYENKLFFTIEMENGDIMKGEIYPDVAPTTVENFVKLCDKNFYDGLIFHRVIPGFMIQGGGFDKELNGKKASQIKGEFSANGIENPLKHTRGVISMARALENDTASSQFFIMHRDNADLDGNYAAFGKITEGLEVIDKIATVKTEIIPEAQMYNFPVEAQVIKTITIEK